MRKGNQKSTGPYLHALIERAQMNDLERQKALDAMRTAESFASAVLWVRERVAAMGTWFLKPSVRH